MWKTFREFYAGTFIPAGMVVAGGVGLWRAAAQGASLAGGLMVGALFALGAYRLWWRYLGPGRRCRDAG
jgi:hypothetical protein